MFSEFVTSLPRSIKDIPIVIVDRQGRDGKIHEQKLRRAKILAAIEFLASINLPLFKQIQVNHQQLAEYPVDDFVLESDLPELFNSCAHLQLKQLDSKITEIISSASDTFVCSHSDCHSESEQFFHCFTCSDTVCYDHVAAHSHRAKAELGCNCFILLHQAPYLWCESCAAHIVAPDVYNVLRLQ